MAMFGQVQWDADYLIKAHLSTVSPHVGGYIVKNRLDRMSDRERVALVTAVAEDLGHKDVVKRFRSTWDATKAFRDSVGHNVGMRAEDDGKSFWVMDGGNNVTSYTWSQLLSHLAAGQWLSEVITYLLDVGGYSADPQTRTSGALLRDTPPPEVPYTKPFGEPVQRWALLLEDEAVERV